MTDPTLFQHSASYLEKNLALVSAEERPIARLELDLEALLTGPTSGHIARRLAATLTRGEHERSLEVARALIEMGQRYLEDTL